MNVIPRRANTPNAGAIPLPPPFPLFEDEDWFIFSLSKVAYAYFWFSSSLRLLSVLSFISLFSACTLCNSFLFFSKSSASNLDFAIYFYNWSRYSFSFASISFLLISAKSRSTLSLILCSISSFSRWVWDSRSSASLWALAKESYFDRSTSWPTSLRCCSCFKIVCYLSCSAFSSSFCLSSAFFTAFSFIICSIFILIYLFISELWSIYSSQSFLLVSTEGV